MEVTGNHSHGTHAEEGEKCMLMTQYSQIKKNGKAVYRRRPISGKPGISDSEVWRIVSAEGSDRAVDVHLKIYTVGKECPKSILSARVPYEVYALSKVRSRLSVNSSVLNDLLVAPAVHLCKNVSYRNLKWFAKSLGIDEVEFVHDALALCCFRGSDRQKNKRNPKFCTVGHSASVMADAESLEAREAEEEEEEKGARRADQQKVNKSRRRSSSKSSSSSSKSNSSKSSSLSSSNHNNHHTSSKSQCKRKRRVNNRNKDAVKSEKDQSAQQQRHHQQQQQTKYLFWQSLEHLLKTVGCLKPKGWLSWLNPKVQKRNELRTISDDHLKDYRFWMHSTVTSGSVTLSEMLSQGQRLMGSREAAHLARKQALFQNLFVLTQLHGCRIAHGDAHFGNVRLSLAGKDFRPLEKLFLVLASPGAEAYTVYVMDRPKVLVKLIDFDWACVLDMHSGKQPRRNPKFDKLSRRGQPRVLSRYCPGGDIYVFLYCLTARDNRSAQRRAKAIQWLTGVFDAALDNYCKSMDLRTMHHTRQQFYDIFRKLQTGPPGSKCPRTGKVQMNLLDRYAMSWHDSLDADDVYWWTRVLTYTINPLLKDLSGGVFRKYTVSAKRADSGSLSLDFQEQSDLDVLCSSMQSPSEKYATVIAGDGTQVVKARQFARLVEVLKRHLQ